MQREEKSVQRHEHIGGTKRSLTQRRLAFLAPLALAASVCPEWRRVGNSHRPCDSR